MGSITLKTKLKNIPLYRVEERLERWKAQLEKELNQKACLGGAEELFHIWIADDWFCPDGVPGFAVPFYLFNRDARDLIETNLGETEGSTEREILRLMRHELGHALDNAFGLRKDKQRQSLFGDSRKRYPATYKPDYGSRDFVHYLGDRYAQAHPDEDFAETFAYWLDPEKNMESSSLSATVRAKLQCMDRLMKENLNGEPKLSNRYRPDRIEIINDSMRTYLRKKGGDRFRHFQVIDCNIRSMSPGERTSDVICRRISRRTGANEGEVRMALKITNQRAKVLGYQTSGPNKWRPSLALVSENFKYLRANNQLRVRL